MQTFAADAYAAETYPKFERARSVAKNCFAALPPYQSVPALQLAQPTYPSYSTSSSQGCFFRGFTWSFTGKFGHSGLFQGYFRFRFVCTQFCNHNNFQTPTLGNICLELIPFDSVHCRNVANADVGDDPMPNLGFADMSTCMLQCPHPT